MIDEAVVPGQPGLHLIIKVEGGELTILRSAPVGNATRRDLEPPFLDPRRRYQFDVAVEEIALELVDGSENVLESWAWPWAIESFVEPPYEQLEGRPEGRLAGGRQYYESGVRIVVIPVDTRTAELRFWRSTVTAGVQPRAVIRTSLGDYAFQPPGPGSPRTLRALPGDAPLTRLD